MFPYLSTLPRTFRLLAVLVLGGFLAACDSGSGEDSGGADSMPPALVSVTSNGTSLTASFNEALDPTSAVASAFALSPTGTITSASASGSSVTLALASALDDDAAQTYTLTATGIRDAAGNAAGATSATFTFGSGGGGAGTGGSSIGAAYPNAGDSRLVLLNTSGTRFLLFNPVTGAVTDADDLDDIENGLIPLDNVGAAASFDSEGDTYFFSTDGDTFTNYERQEANFDAPASFEEEYDELGYELPSIGAAASGNQFASNSMILFNGNGTQWQLWQPGSGGNGGDEFSSVFSFPAGFGGGGSPISAVGAAFYRSDVNELYLFNREGTQYTIWRGGNNFTAAFDVEELGDIEF